MKNREIGEPVEYEIIYKDKIIPVVGQAKSRKERKPTYKAGFITMIVVALLILLGGVGG